MNAFEWVLNALENGWMCSECTWMPLSEHWMQLNTVKCALSVRECLWVSIECIWMRLSVHKHLWVSLNVTECTQLLIAIWKWVHMTPLSKCECDWMCLNMHWVHVNAFEWALDNALECALSARDCLWVSIQCDWTRLNALWVPVNAFEQVLNATEHIWTCLSGVNATEWVFCLCQCTPLVEVI
jgi:hypothetical protein